MITSNIYPKGLLCSVEGIDGSGKSSLLQSIAAALKDTFPIITTKEPGGTSLGRHLRAIIQDQPTPIIPSAEFLLFAADRAQHFADLIIPNLEKNYIVLSDRMADSSLVYQGFGKNLDIPTLKMINQWIMQNIHPDIVFYVKIDAQTAIQRMHIRNQGFSKFEETTAVPLAAKLAQGYDVIFKDQANVIILDGNLTIEELTKICVETIIIRYKAKQS